MGVVYRAYDHDHSRMVAIKVIDSELSSDPAFRERFERERRAQASLDAHPYIVDIHSSGESDDGLYLVMKFIDGPNLGQMLEHGPPSPPLSVAILEPIADALDFAHQAGPIHRDLKPQNILLDARQRSFLTDFGLAWVPGQSRMTTTGVFMGTTAYASPEQLRGGPTTGASDIYSLTCVMFECLTGQVPFPGDTHIATALAHASNDRPVPSKVNASLPAQIDDVISRGMAKDPLERYDSATGLLRDALDALGECTVEPPHRNPRKAIATGRRPHQDATQLTTHPPVSADSLGRAPLAATPERAAAAKRGASVPRLLVGLGFLVVALLGFALARGANESQAIRLTSSVGSEHLKLRYPTSWEARGSGAQIPGLRLSSSIELHERAAPGTRLMAGISSAEGKLLLPARFLKTLSVQPEQNAVVDLGGRDAYYYPDLRSAGSPPVDLYVMPTTAGIATIACGAGGNSGGTALCARIADSLALRRARAYPLGPSRDYARRLNRELARLQRQRNVGRGELNAAKTAAAQERSAAGLRDSFSAVASALSATHVSPQSARVSADVVASLRRAASAYDQLAAAATIESARSFNAARWTVRRAETQVEHKVHGLSSLDYVIRR